MPKTLSNEKEAHRGRGRPKVQSDQAQIAMIIENARRLFLERGYGGTTMNDVVARCRVSKRTLYRLFPGKTDLWTAVVDMHRQSMLALPGDYDDLTIQDALERILQVDIDMAADAERTAFLRLMLVESAQFPEVGHLMRKLGANKSRILLAEWLERQKRLGRIDVDDPSSAAAMIMDMSFGAVILKSGHDPEWPGGQDRRAYLRQCIHIFVNGIRPNG